MMIPNHDILLAALDARGFALLPGLLGPDSCAAVAALYDNPALFRSRIDMARHRFGRGEYQYFADPLPSIVSELREVLYPPLATVANSWAERLGGAADYPAGHQAYRARCHAAGQTRPTPLLLRYGPGDFNHLHQDVYGPLVFPLQVAVLLDRPGTDFSGGEFVLTEARPRQQSRVQVVPLTHGDAVVFPVRERPVHGTRSWYRAGMRHGVSELINGRRQVLGIIFHDAA